jgi:NAD(P)-dependent dehydrogenase (short-subunit alcohol dehydrogenase family)
MTAPEHPSYDCRHALVTGAGTGIGAAIATALAEAGCRVTLAGRRPEPLREVAARLGSARTRTIDGFDVTDPDLVRHGVAAARTAFGPIDILVNNAGEAPSAPFAKTDLATWNRVLAVNLTGAFLVTQAVLGDMIAQSSGRIINIASIAGLAGAAYVSAYVASKHGLVGLTRALAVELAGTGITVNAVCPGYTDTPLVERAVATISAKTGLGREQALARLTASNPQGRLIKPEEVAYCVLWLASSGASAVSGQAIVINGGSVPAGC